MKIQVIIGSTRPNRFSEKPAQWIYKFVKNKKVVEVELLDLRDYPLPFFNEAISPKRIEGNYSDKTAKKWVQKVDEGDAYIIVTPEYNHGYPAVLKNALDYPYKQWNKKPVGFISYGNVGGARSVEQLRQVAIELQMTPIQPAIHIPSDVTRAAKENKPNPFESLNERAELFLNDLLWWTTALKNARNI